jgi:hypothetical protein
MADRFVWRGDRQASMATPVRKLVRYQPMATGHIRNPNARLIALRNNLRLHVIGPTAVPTPRLYNITPTDKPFPAVRHQRPPSNNADLLAPPSDNQNAHNQWERNGAYNDMHVGGASRP